MIYNIHTIWTDPCFSDIMCRKPYWNHPHGCPNYGKKKGCPPKHKNFWDVFDSDFYLIFTEFDLKVHVSKLKKLHPKWTRFQLYCCLYWQGKARKNLKKEIEKFKTMFPNHIVTTCPEAMGVNVTDLMMDNAGVELEWPVETVAYQVAIAGLPKKKNGTRKSSTKT